VSKKKVCFEDKLKSKDPGTESPALS